MRTSITATLRRRLALLLAVAVMCGTLAACSMSGLVFRDDATISVDAPANNGTVGLPVRVTWHLKAGSPPPASWAVLMDRTPPGPGAKLPENRSGIVVTGQTSTSFDYLSPNTGGTREERNRHSVVVIMLDAQGRRMGELSGFAEFEVRS